MATTMYFEETIRDQGDKASFDVELGRSSFELRADLADRGIHADVLAFCRSELVAENESLDMQISKVMSGKHHLTSPLYLAGATALPALAHAVNMASRINELQQQGSGFRRRLPFGLTHRG
jgi:hypothetical protein